MEFLAFQSITSTSLVRRSTTKPKLRKLFYSNKRANVLRELRERRWLSTDFDPKVQTLSNAIHKRAHLPFYDNVHSNTVLCIWIMIQMILNLVLALVVVVAASIKLIWGCMTRRCWWLSDVERCCQRLSDRVTRNERNKIPFVDTFLWFCISFNNRRYSDRQC